VGLLDGELLAGFTQPILCELFIEILVQLTSRIVRDVEDRHGLLRKGCGRCNQRQADYEFKRKPIFHNGFSGVD
jgi:hypothetical protein